MKNLILLLISMICCYAHLSAQVILKEDFEGGVLPADWTTTSSATDGGWQISDPASLSSQYWPIADNGSSQIAATNDDACNCNKSKDYLVTPWLDFTGLTAIALEFDYLYGQGTYQNFTEKATIEISFNGTTWTVFEELFGHGVKWNHHRVDLSSLAGRDSVWIAFHYNDGGSRLYGLAVDNIRVEAPLSLDASLT